MEPALPRDGTGGLLAPMGVQLRDQHTRQAQPHLLRRMALWHEGNAVPYHRLSPMQLAVRRAHATPGYQVDAPRYLRGLQIICHKQISTCPLGSARQIRTRSPHCTSKRGNRYLRALFVQAAWVVRTIHWVTTCGRESLGHTSGLPLISGPAQRSSSPWCGPGCVKTQKLEARRE
jgi:hypothetical protein